jgi:hypothetical protein
MEASQEANCRRVSFNGARAEWRDGGIYGGSMSEPRDSTWAYGVFSGDRLDLER